MACGVLLLGGCSRYITPLTRQITSQLDTCERDLATITNTGTGMYPCDSFYWVSMLSVACAMAGSKSQRCTICCMIMAACLLYEERQNTAVGVSGSDKTMQRLMHAVCVSGAMWSEPGKPVDTATLGTLGTAVTETSHNSVQVELSPAGNDASCAPSQQSVVELRCKVGVVVCRGAPCAV